MKPPDFPAGEFVFNATFSVERLDELVEQLRAAPDRLRAVVRPLNDEQLDTPYRNWSVRQIVHHLADSHVHVYIRFKWTITENEPLIKAYDEGSWSALPDARTANISAPLDVVDAIHARWLQLVTTMQPDDFHRVFHHPQFSDPISLWECMNYYPWHCRHHTAQIEWLVEQHGWR